MAFDQTANYDDEQWQAQLAGAKSPETPGPVPSDRRGKR